jgi:hypothetical protein
MDIRENNLQTSVATYWKRKNLFSFTSWNVRDIWYEEYQLEDNLIKKNTHVAVLSETMSKQKYTKETSHCIHIQSGVKTNMRVQTEDNYDQ